MDLHRGDCLEVLKQFKQDTIDALITDPPAGISFMGKEWDSGNNFIPAMTEIFKECLRVMKPGAHGLVWALPRTSHWTATALESAGFEIRDIITHLFGSGFPKSLDISKAIDKAAGADRELIGYGKLNPRDKKTYEPKTNGDVCGFNRNNGLKALEITAPATSEAKQWQGWGTALKPASEHWILIRRPLSEKTIAANVLKWGCGGINIDECRIGTDLIESGRHGRKSCKSIALENENIKATEVMPPHQGRFPANLVLDEIAAEMLDEQSGVRAGDSPNRKPRSNKSANSGEIFKSTADWETTGHSDSGGASRFFYCAKSSKKDRNEGLEGMPEVQKNGMMTGSGEISANMERFSSKNQNFHPTVKSTKLMEYLIKLITPPNGVILDPFMGSGSTGVAAKRLGFEFIGIEKNEEYFEIAEKRIEKSTTCQ